ncbi:lactosylceramide 4-alpha-galactosyltransferase [Vigna unguiculata]|uniref:Lactosylceramide 4-alpha-galactosyltransferase n=1 Tax=Vigna unguiculata TaxID=3917 RepID=A0A4D6KHN6_VIGUN|nr:lactosylceramide 4-alpha-galactosyltransferase [Vigna unguiculata]
MFHPMEQSAKLSLFPFLHLKRSMLSLLLSLPTSFFVFLLLLLLSYNAYTVFSLHLPNSSSLRSPPPKPLNLSSSAHSPLFKNPHLPLLPNSTQSLSLSIQRAKRVKKHKRGLRSVRSEPPRSPVSPFHSRLRTFFNTSCQMRFFMTWISPLKTFGERELVSVESLFKSHPEACVVIVSKSLDSCTGTRILKPFVSNGFRVIAIAPDFGYIFKNTHAELWFNRLKEGYVNPGEVSLGQNLSNLLRLALLYKFGGTYIDLDVIVLKSFSKLRNTVGAQTFDVRTGKWSRLNNAVLIFDKKHPLLLKFIEEFALTFDGNKWGHNGPYLISRVVSRVNGTPGFNFTVLPPSAFYPVDWRGIRGLFGDGIRSKWWVNKMKQIRKESFALHLWNRHSRTLKVVKGSILDSIISSCCIFCNT